MRGVTTVKCPKSSGKSFQLTRLMRGVTLNLLAVGFVVTLFQLTRLMRGVTEISEMLSRKRAFQLTRLMRGVTVNHFFLVSSE